MAPGEVTEFTVSHFWDTGNLWTWRTWGSDRHLLVSAGQRGIPQKHLPQGPVLVPGAGDAQAECMKVKDQL